MAIRKSTLKYFAESITDQLEEVASKLEAVENILSGDDENANGVEDEDEYVPTDDVPPVDEDEEELPPPPVEDPEVADEEEEVTPPVDDEATEENYSTKRTNFAATRKPAAKTTNFSNRYAKVKDFLSGAM